MQKSTIALTAMAAATILIVLFAPGNQLKLSFFQEPKNEGYLMGSVDRSDGIPVPNYKIIVYEKGSGDLIKVLQTDANGNYAQALNIGDYRIVTSQGTYEVTIESGKTTTLDIQA